MTISVNVASQQTGKPLQNVTVWEIQSDGQGAWVLGQTDYKGDVSVDVDSGMSALSFAIDGYTGQQISIDQLQNTDQVLLTPVASASATTTTKIPVWIWVLVGFGFIWLSDKKKR